MVSLYGNYMFKTTLTSRPYFIRFFFIRLIRVICAPLAHPRILFYSSDSSYSCSFLFLPPRIEYDTTILSKLDNLFWIKSFCGAIFSLADSYITVKPLPLNSRSVRRTYG